MKHYDASAHDRRPAGAGLGHPHRRSGYARVGLGRAKVEGRIAPGEKIKVVSEANPGRAFPVKVAQFAPGQRMVWSGGMPLGLFKGVRTFTLTPEGSATRFEMREEYTGPLLP